MRRCLFFFDSMASHDAGDMFFSGLSFFFGFVLFFSLFYLFFFFSHLIFISITLFYNSSSVRLFAGKVVVDAGTSDLCVSVSNFSIRYLKSRCGEEQLQKKMTLLHISF